MTAPTQQSAISDPTDQAIIRALQLAPRIPFAVLADVLGVSEQTVARRYQRLRRSGMVRVTAIVSAEALGESNWVVRIDCRPTGATSLAQALAQRADVGWVSLISGGTQVLCTVRSQTAAAREELLLQRLPRTTQVLGMSASMLLHRFVGGSADDWSGFVGSLTPEQEEALRASNDWPTRTANPAGQAVLDDTDTALLAALEKDGRASVASLAAAAGVSEGRAGRRLRSLFADSVAYLDLDVPTEAFGIATSANLWLTTTPAHLDDVGRELAACPEVAFAAAISGTHNLYVVALCRDIPSLYRFVTERVGSIAGVATMEVSPVLRVVKQAGTLVSDGRLAT